MSEFSGTDYGLYVGLDVHKDTVAVGVARAGREGPEYRGEIANTPKALSKLVARLSTGAGGEVVLWCYEAGPCGYGIYRQLLSLGHDCEVVAAPRSDAIKTDRRDAMKLARKLRAGELRRVWVPDVEQEAMRDLIRTQTGCGCGESGQTALAQFSFASWAALREREILDAATPALAGRTAPVPLHSSTIGL